MLLLPPLHPLKKINFASPALINTHLQHFESEINLSTFFCCSLIEKPRAMTSQSSYSKPNGSKAMNKNMGNEDWPLNTITPNQSTKSLKLVSSETQLTKLDSRDALFPQKFCSLSKSDSAVFMFAVSNEQDNLTAHG